MKLTKKEVLNLNTGLTSVGNLTGLQFVYAVARNLAVIKDEVMALQKAYKADEDFLAYEKERIALAKKYAEKHEGNPQKYIDRGVEMFAIKDQETFDEELGVFKKKYKKARDARKKQLGEFEVFLTEEVNLKIHKIPFKAVPKTITALQMSSILIMVESEGVKTA